MKVSLCLQKFVFIKDLFFGEWRTNAVTSSGEHEEETAANNADDDRQTCKELLDIFGRNREQTTDHVLINHGDCEEDEHRHERMHKVKKPELIFLLLLLR